MQIKTIMKSRELNLKLIADIIGAKNKCAAKSWRSALTIAAIVLMSLRASAEGFRNPPPGTFDLGRAGGRIAQVDDSSAVQQNPANLIDLATPEFQFTPSVVYIHADYQSPGGQSAKTKEPWKLLPNLFATAPLWDGRLALGVGLTTPYGLGNEWNINSSAFSRPAGAWRYQAPYSTELKTINFNPSVALKVNDKLSLGAGLDVMWSQVTLKQFYPWFLATGNFADPDGHAEVKADGIGAGANFGLTWKLTDRQRFAFTYRTPVRVDYDGNFEVNDVPAVLGGGKMKGDFKTSIKFPSIVSAGYGVELTDKIRVEADVEWLEFSNFKSLPLKSATATALGFPTSIRQNWRDTFTAGIGGDWKFAENWVARAGYQYYESPVPNSTFSPTIADANQNVFTVGLGYKYKHHSLEAGYGLDFYDDRNIKNDQNPAFNGKYQITVHLFSFAYRYAF
jgi:long-chain fatty acid transport protein